MKDFCLHDDRMISNNLENILQQIDILFDAAGGDVIGNPRFGTEYNEFLYDLQITNTKIQRKIQNDINSWIELDDWICEVSVDLMRGVVNDIILVRISLMNGENEFKKDYKITK